LFDGDAEPARVGQSYSNLIDKSTSRATIISTILN
jgi:hypothetical protein